jgi:hypothetical protein
MSIQPLIHFSMGTNQKHEITITADGNAHVHVHAGTRTIRWTAPFRFRIHLRPVECLGITATRNRAAFWLPQNDAATEIILEVGEDHLGAWKYTIVPCDRILPLDPIIIIDT